MAARLARALVVAPRATGAACRQPELIFSGSTLATCRQSRGLVQAGVDKIDPPRYTKVPIVAEEPEKLLADMPELVLGGRGSGASTQTGSQFLGLPMNEAAPIDKAKVLQVSAGEVSTDLPVTHFAELENGVRVAAVDRQGLCSSLGLFVHTGSRYLPVNEAFLPHMLELMAFRSCAHLSHLRTLKTLEQLGASATCRVGREDILYQMDVLREYVPVALPLMLANLICPSVLEEEVAELQQNVMEVQANLQENPDALVVELLHVAAYQGNSLGHTVYAEEKDLPSMTSKNLRDFMRRECTPDKLILVGVNVDFEELCKWTARSFAEHSREGFLPAKSSAGVRRERGRAGDVAVRAGRDMAPAKYTGGDIRLEQPNPLCHLMLGWEVEGGWNGKWLAAVTVLQMFLGGGGSFSTGGPGKGMHTRLYTEVLSRHHWVESCHASTVMYVDSGLFTIYSTLLPQNSGDFIGVLARIFEGVKQISDVELKRAKNSLKSSIHMNLEMRAVMMEDIGRQLILSGKVGTAQEFSKMVDAITQEDLVQTLQHCLQKPPTVVAYGSIEKVLPYEQISQTFSTVLQTPKK